MQPASCKYFDLIFEKFSKTSVTSSKTGNWKKNLHQIPNSLQPTHKIKIFAKKLIWRPAENENENIFYFRQFFWNWSRISRSFSSPEMCTSDYYFPSEGANIFIGVQHLYSENFLLILLIAIIMRRDNEACKMTTNYHDSLHNYVHIHRNNKFFLEKPDRVVTVDTIHSLLLAFL